MYYMLCFQALGLKNVLSELGKNCFHGHPVQPNKTIKRFDLTGSRHVGHRFLKTVTHQNSMVKHRF